MRLLVETLIQHGFELMTALNGADALLSAREGRPDLILLDIRMPGMDGMEVCARLKADPATRPIPVLFLSAVDDVESKLQAFRLGAIDYVTKPFDSREVLARVVLHLDQERLRRTLQQQSDALRDPAAAAPSPASEPSGVHPVRLHKGVQRVAAHLCEHLAESPSLDQLARLARTNRRSLNQGFQELYGMSVFHWQREQRLVEAARLLRASELPIAQIASCVGFGTHQGLVKAFRERFAVTPSDYRDAER